MEQTSGPQEFVIGDRNETSVIRNLTEINGIFLAQLEKTMHGGFTEEDEGDLLAIAKEESRAYTMGFFDVYLGPRDNLIDTLARDNDTVLGMGLTHQQLADFLALFMQSRNTAEPVIFNGKTYVDRTLGSRIAATSPFGDGIRANVDHHLTRMEDNSEFWFSEMLPEMVRRYGFYEGEGTPFRVDPRKLAEFAGFVPKQEA